MGQEIIQKIQNLANEILTLSIAIAREKENCNDELDKEIMDDLSHILFKIQSELSYDCEVDAKFLWG